MKAKGKTFGQLSTDWLRRIAKRRVCPDNERRHIHHMRALAALREGQLTKGAIDDAFGELLAPAGELGPASVNKLCSTGRLIIRDAQGNNDWHGPNPFELVRRERVPRRVYLTLTLPEVALVLPHLRRDRRRLSKTILMVGMRPGEALGLQKTEVDLARKMIRICRSHGRPQTKTGKEREFPIPDELLEDLREAMAEHPTSKYVFPRPDGTRQLQGTKLTRILRTAMKKARLVTGYRYICRRQGCRRVETRDVEELELDCPECGFRFWVSPIPRAMRFYDLRHSSSTLHRKAKCDPLVIQEMLGHASNITDGTYTHLDEDYKRLELNRLKLG